MPAGRPTDYKPEFSEQAEKLCKLGATDKDLADFFEVSIRTIERWRVQHEDFCRAGKSGKDEADNRVERSLFNRAVGYTFESEKIFNNKGEIVRAPCLEHVPPDVTAAIFWLKNRRKDEWRDRIEAHVNHTLTLPQAFEDYIRALNEERDAKVINGAVATEGRRVEILPAPVRSRGTQSET
jgi:hypothetical protein